MDDIISYSLDDAMFMQTTRDVILVVASFIDNMGRKRVPSTEKTCTLRGAHAYHFPHTQVKGIIIITWPEDVLEWKWCLGHTCFPSTNF